MCALRSRTSKLVTDYSYLFLLNCMLPICMDLYVIVERTHIFFRVEIFKSAPANSYSGSEEHISEITASWIASCNSQGCKTHKSHFNFRSLVELLLPTTRYIDQPAGGNSHNEYVSSVSPIEFAIIRFTDQRSSSPYSIHSRRDEIKNKNPDIHTLNECIFWHVCPLDSVKLTLSYSILDYSAYIKESDERISYNFTKAIFIFIKFERDNCELFLNIWKTIYSHQIV